MVASITNLADHKYASLLISVNYVWRLAGSCSQNGAGHIEAFVQ